MKRERIKKVEVRQISQCYDGKINVLKNINFEIPIGECVVVHGGPGSGKSLLLKIISGLYEPTFGSVLYNEKKLSDLSFEEFIPIRLSTAICFENGGLLMNKTLEENLKISLLYHCQWRSERSRILFEKLTQDFKLNNYLALRPAQVSAGVRKIAGLVRAILSNPQILFLDEPSLGIGEEATETLKSWIKEFRNGSLSDQTVFIVTQDSKFMKDVQTRSWGLREGQILMEHESKKAAS